MRIDRGFGEDLIKESKRKGADQAEVFVRRSRSLSVEVKDQAVDSIKSSLSFGYSVRVIRNGRLGFAYSNDPDEKGSVLGNAVETALYADEDKYLDLPEDSGKPAEMEISDPAIKSMVSGSSDAEAQKEAVEKVMSLERHVYQQDKRIRKVRKAMGSFTLSETLIMNSEGVSRIYESTSCSAQVTAVAEDAGESQVGGEFDASRFLSEVSFEDTGTRAARNAVRLLGCKKMEGCRADVVLDNSVSVDFLGIFAGSISAEAVQKGKSLLAGRLGKRIISPLLNITDSGLLPSKVGSRPVDDEGVPVSEKVVVKEGTLECYLHNTYTSRKEGVLSTGNAARGSYASLPSVGVTNFYLEAARKADIVPEKEIFNGIKKGLYVTDVMGIHTANPISGDFSVGVSGILIQKGSMLHPVKEAVISGNILDLFKKVRAVGNDLRFYGNIGAPSLIISDVDISA